MSEGRLDIQVNTGSVKQAIIDLDKLPASTARAEAAATKLTTGFDKAGAGATMMGERIAAAANSASGIASKLNGAMDMSNLDKTLQATVADLNIQNVAVRNGTTAASAHSESIRGQRLALRGLAQDLMFLGPAYGQTAAMAATLYIDNMHLIGGWSGLKTAIGALLTPMNLLIGGAVAVAAGMYMINKSITETEKKFGDLADRTNTTLTQLHALESTTAFKGISTADFTTGMEKFNDLTVEAVHNQGSLKELFRANGVATGDVATNWDRAADLIKNARSEAEKYRLIQQLGLPATAEWVRYLSQGSQGIKDAAAEASKMGGAFDEQMIKKAREFDEAWDKGWKNFTTSAKQAFIDVKGGIGDIITWANHLGQDLHPGMLGLRLNNAFGDVGSASDSSLRSGLEKRAGQIRNGGDNTKNPVDIKDEISRAQQYLGLLGATTTAEEARLQVQKQFEAAAANGIGIDSKRAEILKQLAYDQNLGLTALRQQTDAYNVQAAAVSMSTAAATTYTAVQNELNNARRNGKVLTDEQIESIKREAEALGQAAQKADEAKFELDTLSSGMRDIGLAVRNGTLSWQTFGNVASNALGKVADRLMDMASKAMWQAAFPGGGSIGGGILGLLGLGGGGGGAGQNAGAGLSASVSNPSMFANGGTFSGPGINALSGQILTKPTMFAFANGAGIAGEAGDEAVMPLTRVNGKLGVRAAGNGNMGGQPVTVTVAPSYTFHNADPAVEGRLRQQIAQTAQQTKDETLQLVDKTFRNNAGYLK